MKDYHLALSAKTRFLNFFRRIFILPLFERFLLGRVAGKANSRWRKLIPPDYLYRSGKLREVLRDGIRYKLDIAHVVDHFLFWGYQDRTYDHILEEIRNAEVILDIGGNIGTTALYFASLNSSTKIYSFEPHPGTFARAQENLALNGYSNIQLVNIGLGEKPGKLKLYEVNEHNPGMNRIIQAEKDLPYKLIEIETPDSFVSRNQITGISIIKLDVEGFEYSVLLGAKESILRHKPLLFIELDDANLRENNSSAKALIELLNAYGYSIILNADDLTPVSAEQNFTNCHFDIIARSGSV